VSALPIATPGYGSKRTLQIGLDPPPESGAVLNVWLRGEDTPRLISVHL